MNERWEKKTLEKFLKDKVVEGSAFLQAGSDSNALTRKLKFPFLFYNAAVNLTLSK